MNNLRNNDYEDNDSGTYQKLTQFIDEVKNEDKLETHQSTKVIQSVEAFRAMLHYT
jgi:hypothetical protein